MVTSQGSRTLWLLLGATLVAAAPARAQHPVAERTAAFESVRAEAERTMAELRDANVRLIRFQEALRGAPALTRAQADTLGQLRRLTAIARMRAVEASARLEEERRLVTTSRLRSAELRAVQAAAPRGYFGVGIEQASGARAQGGPPEDPRVATVEPGSPAAKAGLRAGDRLLRVGDVVMRRGGDLDAVLRPGNVVRVRFERDGHVQEAEVRIEPRPLGFRSGMSVTIREQGTGPTRVRMIPAPEVQVLTTIGPEAAPVAAPGVVRGSIPDGRMSLVVVSRSTMMLAGAELTQLDDNLRRALGADHGLYVLSVLPGLPAGRAGVQQGDVLLRAGDVRLDTPVDLMRAMSVRMDAEARELRLHLLRDRKERTVELRWAPPE